MIGILIVSSDVQTRDRLAGVLRSEEMTPSIAADKAEALRQLDKEPPDAVIVNLDGPGSWQPDLCAQIRERTTAPLLVVGRREQELALARSLGLGADAHLLSPYTSQIFLSQLYALLRRVGLARPSVAGRFDVGSLAIDVFSREVRVRGQPVELTPIEFEVLRCLLNNSGRALSYRSLVRQVHGYDCSSEEARKLLKVHIHNLRRKTEPDPRKPAHVLNVRGFGYLFERRRFRRDSPSEPIS